jgi:hypothetical protein
MNRTKEESPLKGTTINRLMDRAIEINGSCPLHCRDFRIMVSPMREDALILRWTTIDLSDVERPLQCFHYECFNVDGTPQNCSVYYENQQEANAFFFSLKTLYRQDFANDHKKALCTK